MYEYIHKIALEQRAKKKAGNRTLAEMGRKLGFDTVSDHLISPNPLD